MEADIRLPPKPAASIPMAKPRFLTNQLETMAVRGVQPARLKPMAAIPP